VIAHRLLDRTACLPPHRRPVAALSKRGRRSAFSDVHVASYMQFGLQL